MLVQPKNEMLPEEIIKITDTDAGLRLDVVMAMRTGKSRSYWQPLIKQNLVLVNNSPVKASRILEAGDLVESSHAYKAQKITPKIPQLQRVYKDDTMIIIDKPAGLLVHAVTVDNGEPTVAAYGATISSDTQQERPGIVHRLDRDTSGLLILAKDAQTKAYLQGLFRERKVKKTYLALVWGRPKEPEALIDLPIGRAHGMSSLWAVAPDGREANTHYKTLANYTGYTLLEVQPRSGRTHQIRVHMSHIGHPIVGDRLYGHKPLPPGLARQFLHATRLRFDGPDGKQIDCSSSLPADLAKFIDCLA